MNKPTCEQLIEQLGDKQDITICSDVVYGLGFEYQQLKNEVDKLKNVINQIEEKLISVCENCYEDKYTAKMKRWIQRIKVENND